MKQPKPVIRVVATVAVLAAAAIAARALYARYVSHPWTRDGQVRADVVLVAPRVAGWIDEVAVKDNQQVAQGDLLFSIDASSFRLAVESSRVQLDEAREQVASLEAAVVAQEAAVEQARTQIVTAKGQIQTAKAQVEAAEGLVAASEAGLEVAQAGIDQRKAELDEDVSERDRARRLADQGAGSVQRAESKAAAAAASKAQLDAARASKTQAQADLAQSKSSLAQAQSNLVIAENGVAEAEAALVTALANLRKAQADLGVPGEENTRVRAAKAALAQAELELGWTRVVAPVGGFVTNLTIDQGVYASAGESMVALVDRSSFWVAGYFQETDIGRIDVGDRAVLTLMSHPDESLEGVVESIGRAIAPPDTGDAGASGSVGLVPSVQPSFDWIRLAQRVPVRVRLDDVPEGIELVSGSTVSVAIRPKD